ncbi:POPLD-domain-containing protein [Choiromyces venosus 120613-1]|uniref:POPLD-domain-containing protein n=1 Tax=Choiromyces venosus 120613-1 TaxID=1336337 RepID=A0A3N4JS97_9PEZI|nr:POPLD-domain-containing protein [Choiromyces venosus 120613-1]
MPPSTPNPRKRAAATMPISGRERKRAKLQDVRTIAVQNTEQALKTGELDVSAFIKSREFEIEALQNAMKASKESSNKRAFQVVPRDMRRRTASHNVKRVPKRLRPRATKEMQSDNTPTVSARRRKPSGSLRFRKETARKLQTMAKKKDITAQILAKIPSARGTENVLRQPPRAQTKFRKRQKHKTWLPTHVWHAKRAKMIVRWRFAVAETPTEKSYRVAHRASGMRGCIAWDESYFSTIMLRGKERDVKEVMKVLCPKDGNPISKKVVAGTRASDTYIYKAGRYPLDLIAPVKVIWCVPEEPEAPQEERIRKLLIRVHPSAFLELWEELLPTAKPSKVAVEDLRFEIGSIEITGPDATNSLLAVLNPIDAKDEDSPSGVWKTLRGLTNPSSLPLGACLSFDVSDPRLRDPPRLPEDKRKFEETQETIFKITSTWSIDRTQPPSSLFSREARTAAVKLQSSQKKINKRKGEAIPGEYPSPLPTDPKIPIVLLTTRRSSAERGVSGAIGSWTVLLPWKWVQPVWYGIVHSGPNIKFGGLDELRQINYENSNGNFPDDFPGTKAGMTEELRKGVERKEWWDKRPKGKRIEWGSVKIGSKKGEIGDGFVCDWAYLLKEKRVDITQSDDSTELSTDASESTEGVAPIGTTASMSATEPTEDTISSIPFAEPEVSSENSECSGDMSSMDIDKPPPNLPLMSSSIPTSSKDTTTTTTTSLPKLPSQQPHPWTIPSSMIRCILSTPNSPLPKPLATLHPEILSAGLFSIKLVFPQRSTPTPRARIYSLPTNNPALKAQWKAVMSKKSQGKRPGKATELPDVPSEEDLIGFVTMGDFNLKEGKGTGVGALSWQKVFGRGKKVGEAVGKACIVRDVGSGIGRLAYWEVID